MCVTIRVGWPTRLTMSSIRVSQILGGPGQKLTFVKKFQLNPIQTRGGPS